MFDKDYLNLTESYDFDVKVYDEDKIFAGNLKLSPQRCSLRIMGERQPSESFHTPKTFICSSLNFYFHLCELKFSYGSTQLLQSKNNQNINFFEYEFDIGFVTMSPNLSVLHKPIENLIIDFKLLKTWIGHTTTQSKILESMNNNCKAINSSEFTINLNNHGKLNLSYSLTSSWDSFSSINKSQPNLKINFNSPKDISAIHKEIKKLYALLAFFIGYDFDLDSVNLIPCKTYFNSKISVYFPKNHSTKLLDYTLYPLGHNLRFEQELPSLPLISFNNFYNLSEADLSLYYRYLGYSRMKSNEE